MKKVDMIHKKNYMSLINCVCQRFLYDYAIDKSKYLFRFRNYLFLINHKPLITLFTYLPACQKFKCLCVCLAHCALKLPRALQEPQRGAQMKNLKEEPQKRTPNKYYNNKYLLIISAFLLPDTFLCLMISNFFNRRGKRSLQLQ